MPSHLIRRRQHVVQYEGFEALFMGQRKPKLNENLRIASVSLRSTMRSTIVWYYSLYYVATLPHIGVTVSALVPSKVIGCI